MNNNTEVGEQKQEEEKPDMGEHLAGAKYVAPHVNYAPGTPVFVRLIAVTISALRLSERTEVFVMPEKYLTMPRPSKFAEKMKKCTSRRHVIVWSVHRIRMLSDGEVDTYLSSAEKAKLSVTEGEKAVVV